MSTGLKMTRLAALAKGSITQGKMVPCCTEEQFFGMAGMKFVPPEKR